MANENGVSSIGVLLLESSLLRNMPEHIPERRSKSVFLIRVAENSGMGTAHSGTTARMIHSFLESHYV